MVWLSWFYRVYRIRNQGWISILIDMVLNISKTIFILEGMSDERRESDE